MTSTPFNVTETHITKTPEIAGGKACIAGRRIRVQDVYVWHEYNGMSADEIANEYDLSLAQIYAALTYAFDHLDEIQADIQQSETTYRATKQHFPSKLPPSKS
ncbi:MAG: hypothetical protein BroJett018_28660 [Chloroflexota bacterium]|nr:DUF433 domain-containing protein [Chloroflexota bacterium]NOG63697.1 DUF433 domain-containing protein [Chloroflexota bacterium]GIK65072.1 MAG: hypothetical protein BroJett018_28660 [Chloroflexota bacterium]